MWPKSSVGVFGLSSLGDVAKPPVRVFEVFPLLEMWPLCSVRVIWVFTPRDMWPNVQSAYLGLPLDMWPKCFVVLAPSPAHMWSYGSSAGRLGRTGLSDYVEQRFDRQILTPSDEVEHRVAIPLTRRISNGCSI
eukprot:TRINITY_DN584_c0_g1_i14.p2 TRINITY_DN584_c0_g1~~TRINITY_DN584_c0_g1_i14.p2  ORF type:complete len:134 (+),score=19.72 TRINITY_DN584_c0_g1_i14:543-944(+)